MIYERNAASIGFIEINVSSGMFTFPESDILTLRLHTKINTLTLSTALSPGDYGGQFKAAKNKSACVWEITKSEYNLQNEKGI